MLCFSAFLHFFVIYFFFFFNDTATTEIYTLSLHDALPISKGRRGPMTCRRRRYWACEIGEHTSELQSRRDLVCRLLLEKKKKNKKKIYSYTKQKKNKRNKQRNKKKN